jgi:27-O-demethylrifamycin SV methyltransferase
VVGITTSASGVAAATELAAGRGLTGAVFEQRDGTDNNLDDGTFDVVWVLESSHLMRDRTALLRECVRVLAPGGRIALCDIIRKRDIPFLEVRARRDDFALLRRAFGDAHMEPLESYTSTLGGYGMTITDASDISLPTMPTFAAWRANVDSHEDTLRGLVGDKGVTDFVESTHVLEAFWKDETLGYGILAAVKGS